MRAVVTADLHYDLLSDEQKGAFRDFVSRVAGERPDVFVIAGDTIGLGKLELREALLSFAGLACPKYILPGNHDLWVADGLSLDYLEGRYAHDVTVCGFRRLEEAPFVAGPCAVIGTGGWYDYSFRDPGIVADARTNYRRQTYQGVRCWNDAHFIRLPVDDAAYAQQEADRLTAQLRSLPPTVERVLAVTHMLAFEQTVCRKVNDPEWNFCNAFQGSARLGEALLADPRVRYHVFGHCHTPARVEIGGLVTESVAATYQKKRYVVVDL